MIKNDFEIQPMNANNYCIILAGGVGSKLWPMSHSKMPKQFLDLFQRGRTMLQMTYDRYARIVPRENIFVSTYKDYVDIVKEQLPDLDETQIVAEPLQISTAPAIALTLMHIIARNPDANVVSAPSDQLITDMDAFESQIKDGFRFVADTKNFLAVGIKPTRPATSYGYLQAGEEEQGGFLRVKSFTEKPDIDFANLFCESGEFYWNTGIFLWNVHTMLDALGDSYPEIRRIAKMTSLSLKAEEVARIAADMYPRIRFQSIDILILEHNFNVFIQPSTFGWADVGSWKNYYDLQQKDRNGNVVRDSRTMLYASKDNLIRVSAGKIAIVHGLEGYMLVENDKMLLLCKKDDPTLVRRIKNDAQMMFGDDVM